MKPLLQSLRIGSFRGLTNLNLEGLSRVNLLVGENNSGKTSAIEAIMLFLSPGDPRHWLRVLSARDAFLTGANLGDTASWLFPVVGRDHPDDRREIELEGRIGEIGEKLRLKYAFDLEFVAKARSPGSEEETADDAQESRKVVHLLGEWFSDFDGAKAGEMVFGHPEKGRNLHPPKIDDSLRKIRKHSVQLVKPQAHRLGQMAVRAVTDAVWSQRKSLLLEILQIFDADITGIEIVEGSHESTLVIDHRVFGPMPLHSFGDGIRKAVVVAGFALRAENGVLIIDEAETALHVKVQEPFFAALIRLADELNIQLFLTTHSLEAVDAIIRSVGNELGHLTAFRLERAATGTIVKTFSGPLLHDMRFEMGSELR
jgi:hypothetical protein